MILSSERFNYREQHARAFSTHSLSLTSSCPDAEQGKSYDCWPSKADVRGADRSHAVIVESGQVLQISADSSQDGYTHLYERGYLKLCERGYINLTVEALVVENTKWHSLFTAEEIARAEKRLKDYG